MFYFCVPFSHEVTLTLKTRSIRNVIAHLVLQEHRLNTFQILFFIRNVPKEAMLAQKIKYRHSCKTWSEIFFLRSCLFVQCICDTYFFSSVPIITVAHQMPFTKQEIIKTNLIVSNLLQIRWYWLHKYCQKTESEKAFIAIVSFWRNWLPLFIVHAF